ncbi:hypothetical protein [Bradyrhizobium sp. S3.2.12]|uniref:hypothetical protein n=1 Tax=Bradyrhizobium sp. S3.2.12 TaxID=3156387 RepID=UPI003390CDDC
MKAPLQPEQRAYAPAWLCIYCSDGRIIEATKRKLNREHIIPFGLGGTATLPRASCKACARITGAIEQSCLRMMLGTTRIRLNLPTRRPEERPSEMQIVLIDGNKTIERTIPASEFPLTIPGLLLPPPGILTGDKPHDRMVGKFWMIRENETADKYLKPGGGYRAGTFNNHIFMQMLAKIAHSFAVAEWGFHSFRPLLRDLIIGPLQTASYWVGGNGDPKPADAGGLHRLELKRELRLGTEYIVCYIRLFANFGAPEYRIVVGTWNEGR